MYFGQDERTPEQKRRDQEHADKRQSDQKLSIGFAKKIREILKESGADVGLVGTGFLSGVNLLVQDGDLTYKIEFRVDHDDDSLGW